jgi:UDP-N-acetylmuramyl pentapeptide phosphotransferase/UDP-N-acetylglucosamine-1-phosphate transferase
VLVQLLVKISIVFLLSWILSFALSRYSGRWAVIDYPNQRSLHSVPKPRLGGIAIVVSILAFGTMNFHLNEIGSWWSLLLILLAFMMVIFISLVDDIFTVSIAMRFTIHLISGAFLVAGGLYPSRLSFILWVVPIPIVLGAGFAILFATWMINLYNFMDGIDGLAAGMGVIGFGTFAMLGALSGGWQFAQVSAGIAAACGGFLWLNFPPAKIFMGDVGSASLGFLAAILMLWANHQNIFPLWLGIVVFSPFIVDATGTVIFRVIHGKPPWRAHREHFYQCLVRFGWGHRKTVLSEYVLMLVCSLLSVILYISNSAYVQIIGLGFVVIAYIGLGSLIRNLDVHLREDVTQS